jgi:hypothetical protein
MGQPEQFAKDTFAFEVGPATHDALAWQDPPEIRLLKIQADGMLLVRDPARVAALEPPWSLADGHDELLLELKMAGDHTHPAAVERILLRRQARQVERMEDETAPWIGVEPVLVSAPIVPKSLRARYDVQRLAPGCYRLGPVPFSFFWVASNELPLRADLVPFLLTRSGKALDQFGVWAVMHLPMQWVLEMLDCLAMSEAARQFIYHRVEDDRPEVLARQIHLAKLILARRPELKRQIQEEGRLADARAALRRVLALRGLVVRPEDDARVDACTDLPTLERWHDAAVVATTATEIFDDLAGKRRAAAQRKTRSKTPR